MLQPETDPGRTAAKNPEWGTAVKDPSDHPKLRHPPRLKPFLASICAAQDCAGVYLHKHDFGTNKIKPVLKYVRMPYFAVYTQRLGGIQRTSHTMTLGKMIFNINSGVKVKSVHRYQGVEDGIIMVRVYRSLKLPDLPRPNHVPNQHPNCSAMLATPTLAAAAALATCLAVTAANPNGAPMSLITTRCIRMAANSSPQAWCQPSWVPSPCGERR